jgi:hypothetical protein
MKMNKMLHIKKDDEDDAYEEKKLKIPNMMKMKRRS